MEKVFDIIIIGGGPSGVSSAIYAKRAGKNVMLIEKMMVGGQIAQTTELKNYPGYTGVSGFDFAQNLVQQLEEFNIELTYDEVLSINDLNQKIKAIKCMGGTYYAKVIILCLGASSRKLEIKNEAKFLGRGVSYCAHCDGNFYKDKVVAIVGGGNTALEDAIYLSNICKKVYVIHRRDTFRGEDILVKELLNRVKLGNVEILYNSIITQINGDKTLTDITIKNIDTQEEINLIVDGLFVAIGRKPEISNLTDEIELSSNGYIIVDQNMKTNIDGVYAAGDIVNKTLRQVVTAVSDGAIATTSALNYLSKI